MHAKRWFVAASLAGCVATAQPAETGKDAARREFERGVTQAQAGDFHAAIRAFEAAYAAKPHYSVLYNIGQAELALGKLAAGVASLERYLAEGGTRVSEARRNEVRALLEASKKRIGALRITPAVPGQTRVWLDGVELTPDAFGKVLEVTVGEHSVLYAGGGDPQTLSVTVARGDVTELALPAPEAPRLGTAALRITCRVPGMTVSVDGRNVGKTPLSEPLLVSSGESLLRVVRVGYAGLERRVELGPNQVASVACNERVLTPLSVEHAAELRVRPVPADALVFIDGRRPAGEKLPFGTHEVRVERDGFVPQKRTLKVARGQSLVLDVVLSPTRARQERIDQANAKRSLVGAVLGSAGVAMLATAGGLWLWNDKRYDAWKASPNRESDLDEVASLQRIDDLSLGLAITGTGLATAGTWLLLTRSDDDD